MLDCGGIIGFTTSFVYLGSLLYYDLSGDHDVDARIKKASKAFEALRDRFFSTSAVLVLLMGKVVAGGVLSVLLYSCESWCLSAASLNVLYRWHHKTDACGAAENRGGGLLLLFPVVLLWPHYARELGFGEI